MYDVIVIGAGPAGCTAARTLAERGRRVLLVERCTHHYEGSGYHTMDIEVRSFDQLGGGDTV